MWESAVQQWPHPWPLFSLETPHRCALFRSRTAGHKCIQLSDSGGAHHLQSLTLTMTFLRAKHLQLQLTAISKTCLKLTGRPGSLHHLYYSWHSHEQRYFFVLVQSTLVPFFNGRGEKIKHRKIPSKNPKDEKDKKLSEPENTDTTVVPRCACCVPDVHPHTSLRLFLSWISKSGWVGRGQCYKCSPLGPGEPSAPTTGGQSMGTQPANTWASQGMDTNCQQLYLVFWTNSEAFSLSNETLW